MNTTVIGLGSMGTVLASTLLDQKIPVTVWNRTPEKANPLLSKGARQAISITDAIDAAPLLIVCLLTYDTVYEALQNHSSHLKGKVIVNLTNGTPQEARNMAAWAAKQGAIYLDGGIMAVPPMIGTPDALIIYSGSQQAFEKHKPQLDILANSQFVGEDAGLAPLYDISLLTGMYGLFTGGLQSMALITSEKVKAKQFIPFLKPWLMAMLSQVEIMAEEIDKADFYGYVSSNMGMQAAAYENITKAHEAAGLSTELMMPLHHLFQRAIRAGYSTANISSLVEVIRKPVN